MNKGERFALMEPLEARVLLSDGGTGAGQLGQERSVAPYDRVASRSVSLRRDWAEANGARARAYNLGSPQVESTWGSLSIHSKSDIDWYKIVLPLGGAGQSMRIDYSDAGGELALELRNSKGTLLLSGAGGAGSKALSLEDCSPGTFYLRVLGVRKAVNPLYSLTLDTPQAGKSGDGAVSMGAGWDWTFLVYLDADNDLEKYGLADLNEMEAVASSPDVAVAVQMDRINGYDQTNGNWTDTRRGIVTHDRKPRTVSTPLTSVGELNMGDGQTLTEFIQWGVQAAPAQHYALVIWDHGDGLSGTCYDDTDGDHIGVMALAQAIADSGVHMDVVGFDVCQAALLEQTYALRDVADVVVASEDIEPLSGWDYVRLLKRVGKNTSMGAEQMGQTMVEAYAGLYGNRQTLSAVRTAALEPLATSLLGFGQAVKSATFADWVALVHAQRKSAEFFTPAYHDLGGFFTALATSATSAGLQAAVNSVLTWIDTAVIANHSPRSSGAGGISIYLPAAGEEDYSSYTATNFDLLSDSRWDDFLMAFLNHSRSNSPWAAA